MLGPDLGIVHHIPALEKHGWSESLPPTSAANSAIHFPTTLIDV